MGMSTGLHSGRDLWAGFRAQIRDQKVEQTQVSRTVRDSFVCSTFWFDLWVRKAGPWSHARGMACTALKTLEANHTESEARRTQNISIVMPWVEQLSEPNNPTTPGPPVVNKLLQLH